ncbi:MAG: hypothetical protein HKM05_01685 [Spirochaetales bacterium]|nr:hypothetical protein [Spirochaetales bacterium]
MKLTRHLFLLLLFTLPGALEAEAWSTWLVPASQVAVAQAALTKAHLFFLTWSTVTVPLGEFSRFIEVPAASLEERLLPHDPRWDPFLKDLKAWWMTPQGERFLIQSTDRARLAGLLQGVATPQPPHHEPVKDLAIFKNNPLIFWLLSFVLFTGLLGFWTLRLPGRRRKVQVWRALGWTILCAVSGTLSPPAGLAWWLFLRQTEAFRPRLPLKPLVFGLNLAGLSVLSWFWFTLGLGLAQALAPALSLLLLGVLGEGVRYWLLRRREERRQQAEHPWFQAVPLKTELPPTRGQRLVPLLFVLVGFLGEVVALSFSVPELFKPSPLSARFWQHCWYQEAVTLGMSWQDYPHPLVLKNYREQEGNLVESSQILMVPNAQWRQQVESTLGPRDIGRVLAQTP